MGDNSIFQLCLYKQLTNSVPGYKTTNSVPGNKINFIIITLCYSIENLACNLIKLITKVVYTLSTYYHTTGCISSRNFYRMTNKLTFKGCIFVILHLPTPIPEWMIKFCSSASQ